jgi:hypothetical protein
MVWFGSEKIKKGKEGIPHREKRFWSALGLRGGIPPEGAMDRVH